MAVGSILFVVMDTHDPDTIVPFWCEVLGTEVDATVADGQYTLLKATEGCPPLAFQRVPEGKSVKNRMHLDIGVADLEAAAARIRELGGAVTSEVYELEGYFWQNVTDPEGHEFDIARV
jgi:predicted enzyme related to lactoylglutathione lyase